MAESKRRNIQQHFVTAAYLAGFTPGRCRDSQLYVYERNSEKVFRQRPDEAAKRRNYYSVPKKDGGYDDSVDTMITALENQAMPVLQKLLRGELNIGRFERALLAYFVAFQELRTPWSRGIFEQLEVATVEHMMAVAARQPGVFEQALKELGKRGEDVSVSAEQVRKALRERRIVAKAKPHASLPTFVSLAPHVGNIYVQMNWTVFRAASANLVTSDAPVVRRDPELRGGFHAGGLLSPTVQIWFPLSRDASLLMTPDNERMDRFFELVKNGRAKEAAKVREALPAIRELHLDDKHAEAVNGQTIINADRFIYSPVSSDNFIELLRGESQNIRLKVSGFMSSQSKEP